MFDIDIVSDSARNLITPTARTTLMWKYESKICFKFCLKLWQLNFTNSDDLNIKSLFLQHLPEHWNSMRGCIAYHHPGGYRYLLLDLQKIWEIKISPKTTSPGSRRGGTCLKLFMVTAYSQKQTLWINFKSDFFQKKLFKHYCLHLWRYLRNSKCKFHSLERKVTPILDHSLFSFPQIVIAEKG